jgi:beta-glucanase (GH16 family)
MCTLRIQNSIVNNGTIYAVTGRKMTRSAFLTLLASAAAAAQQNAGWRLVWSDEFDGPASSAPNPSNWNYDLGGGGWGNNEREVYTKSSDNVFLDGNGHLVIRALNNNGAYTSGRIKTQNRFAFTYGRVEARIRIPYAQGIWPAFWMLGANIETVGWPMCGEIDIMENFGKQNGDAGVNHGTVHGPGYSGGAGITRAYSLPAGQQLSDDFHIFAVQWEPDSIELFVDGNSYSRVTPASLPAGAAWVFDKPFFLFLNVAVGGSPAPVGYPDPSTTFPQDMVVDYVRVYQPVVRRR